MVRYYEFCRLNEGRRLAIFNTDEINAILKRAKAGESFESISKTFNFHRSTIEKVVKDNITPEEYAAINKLSNNRSIKFTDDQINDILKRVRTSEPFLSISKDFSCTTQTIATAVKKNTTPEEYAEIVAVNRKPKLVLTDEQIKDVISRAKKR
jgi:transposase